MGADNFIHIKSYGPFSGLDTSKSKFNLGPTGASIAKNTQRQPGSGGLGPRPGIKRIGRNYATSAGASYGLFKYTNVDQTTGVITEDQLSINPTTGDLYKLTKRTITLTTSSGNTYTVDFGIDATTQLHTFYILNGSSIIYSRVVDTSIGTPDATTNKVSDLISNINSTVGGGSTLITAALGTADGTEILSDFLPALRGVSFSSTITATLTGEWYAVLPTPSGFTGHYFTGWASKLNTAEAEIPASSEMNYCAFITSGYDDIVKYDGRYVYKAGLPQPATYTNPVYTGSPPLINIQDGWYCYAQAYEYRDAIGNIIQGVAALPPSSATNVPGPTQVENDGTSGIIPQPDWLTSTSGYQTNCAVANGIQYLSDTNLTITVDNNTLQIGDTACFRLTLDVPVENDIVLVTSKINARTSTTITIEDDCTLTSGLFGNPYGVTVDVNGVKHIAPFSETASKISWIYTKLPGIVPHSLVVLDNMPISNNLRVNFYRNMGAGLTGAMTDYPILFQQDVWPNNSTGATSIGPGFDQREDDILGPLYNPPLTLNGATGTPGLFISLPRGKYITTKNDRLYLCGQVDDVNSLRRSSVLFGPEYFDFGFGDQLVFESRNSDKITGVGSVGDIVVVGKGRSISTITGDLGSEINIRVQTLTEEMGLTSHNAVVNCFGVLVMPTQLGPISVAPNGQVAFLGASDQSTKSRLEGVFRAQTSDLRRATATSNIDAGLYILHLPNTTDASKGFASYALGTITTPAVDLGTTYIYDRINDTWDSWTQINGTGGLRFTQGRLYALRAGITGSTYTGLLFTQNNTNTIYDFVDWTIATPFQYGTRWEDLGEPLQLKSPLKVRIYSNEDLPLAANNMSIVLTTEKDWLAGTTSSQATLSMNGLTTLEAQTKLKTTKCKAMRVILTSGTIYTKPVISAIELEVAAPFKPKIKAP